MMSWIDKAPKNAADWRQYCVQRFRRTICITLIILVGLSIVLGFGYCIHVLAP